MNPIAIYSGNTVIYWSSIIICLGVAAWFALSFALYHTAMMLGWFPPLLFLLALAGLTAGGVLFNLLDARAGTIFPSWAVHIFANLAINTVGFILFKIL